MSTIVPTTPHTGDRASDLEERVKRLESVRTTVAPLPAPAESKPLLLTNILQGATLLAVLSFAFWLGSLSTTISNTSQRLDKLNDAIVGASKDSLSSRISVIGTKLDAVDRKIEKTEPR